MPDDYAREDGQENFAQMFEESQNLPRGRRYEPGDELTGTVVLLTEEHVFINYGGKGEAYAEIGEFKDEEGKLTVAVGDQVTLKVIEGTPNGLHLGNTLRRTGSDAGLDLLESSHESGVPVEGFVLARNKGGFDIRFGETTAFCPVSQIDLVYCDNPDVFVGSTHLFKVTEFDPDDRRIVVSRRALLEAERKERAAETRKQLAEGAIFEGVVARIQSFGAFIDLGGLDGFLHVSEISRRRVGDPHEVLKVGDSVRVQVLTIGKDDKGRERIGLSMRTLEVDPWDALPFHEGDVVTGAVVRLQPFGAFVELLPGVDGLVHVSEIAWERVGAPGDKLEIGQTVNAKVLGIDSERRRVSLSIKETLPLPETAAPEVPEEQVRSGDVIRRRKGAPGEESPAAHEPDAASDRVDGWAEADSFEASRPAPEGGATEAPAAPLLTPRVGLVTKGVVASVMPYGVFVDLPELGAKARGLIHMSELHVGEGRNQAEPQSGEVFDVEILRIDERGRLGLSRKSVVLRREREEYSKFMNKSSEKGGMRSLGDLLKNVKLK